MSTYLFYDLETSGLNRAFDQVLRFAAIRTDMLFREIDRHTLSIKLRPDIVISPEAMIVNRISIDEAMEGINEYEAILQIHRMLNEAGTISLGYNTIGFDDEFLRFSFHRNLLSPYTHQWDKGCSRMDILPITTVYCLYKQEVLNWPEDGEKVSLKLENLSVANQLASGPAHDAMVDVEAVLALTRKLSAEEEMWNYLVGYFNKDTDRSRMEKLPTAFSSSFGQHMLGLMVNNGYGPESHYQVPAIYIGDSIPYSNQTLWLRLDLPELQQSTEDTIEEHTWVIRKRLGEPDFILPPLERYWQLIGEERQSIVEENQKWLKENPEIFGQIVDYHCHYTYPVIPDLDPETALYEMGFLSRKDQELCRQFHLADRNGKMNLANKFSSQETRILAERVLCRNYPGRLPNRFSKNYNRYMKRVNPKIEDQTLLDFKGDKRRTPFGALQEIEKLRKEADLDDVQIGLLDGLERYLKNQFDINGI